MASAIQPITSSAGSTGQAGTTPVQASGIDTLANEQTFLKLLVAQLKNQNPESPADGTQFVAQLAQFSELEQVIGIRADLDNMQAALGTTAQPKDSKEN